jgi:hypothetical protein
MAVTRYQYTVDSDGTFPNHKVDLPRFEQEIRASSITIALECSPQVISGNCCIDFKTALSENEVLALESLVHNHSGEHLPVSASNVNVINTPSVLVYPPDGLKRNAITPNWCDRTTWYYSAGYASNEAATCDDPNVRTVYSLAHVNVIDTYHGKILGEDSLTDSANRTYRVSVTVNSVEKVEQDPHQGTGGDFTLNYVTGKLTFLAGQPVDADVRVTYQSEYGSAWII